MERKIQFIGRQKGAIGIRYPIIATVHTNDVDEAIEELYQRYDHISFRKWVS